MTAYSAVVLSEGPVAYFWCAGAPSTLTDQTGHGHDATKVTHASSIKPIVDGGSSPSGTGAMLLELPSGAYPSLTFPATVASAGTTFPDYYEIANPGTLPTDEEPWSLECWISPLLGGRGGYSAAADATGGGLLSMTQQTTTGVPGGSYYTLAWEGNDSAAALRLDQHSSALLSLGVPPDQWHYVVATGDGAGHFALYVGCLLVATGTSGGQVGVAIQNAWLGLDELFYNVFGSFSGYMADPAIYDVVLTPLQVKRHYEAATGVPCQRPWAQIQILD